MIKPQGPKAKRRKPRPDVAGAPPKRIHKSDGEAAPVKVEKTSRSSAGRTYRPEVDQSDEPEAIPRSLAGRWIAWSSDGMRIIGSGMTLNDAEEAASRAGESEPILERAGGMVRR